ncbi:hypothetical protein BJY01DRAFT_125745 [Aspergillus pseudoustus]|uniref:Uncharacterized protein n=1 Tax=Aspergillus pseudoustus TaxID=1810923 RepID=A0ABR4KHP5_9EURO
MLGIQKSLETTPSAQMRPLVWFLANRGDEWRVYGCVPDRNRIRVIDLWHGCLLRHDSALQLLIIIDLICDWARDIFAEQVMSSLRKRSRSGYSVPASQDSLEEVAFIQPGLVHDHRGSGTPTISARIPEESQSIEVQSEVTIKIESTEVLMDEVTSTHGDMQATEGLLSPVAADEHPDNSAERSPSISHQLEGSAMMETTDATAEAGACKNTPASESLIPTTVPHRLSETSAEPTQNIGRSGTFEKEPTGTPVIGVCPSAGIWAGEAPVPTVSTEPLPESHLKPTLHANRIGRDSWPMHVERSAKDVELQFRSISLPESCLGLIYLLKELGWNNTEHGVKEFLPIFNRHDPLVVDSRCLNRLWDIWRGSSQVDPDGVQPRYACLVWRARFDYNRWILIHELSCITASEVAIKALTMIGYF